MATEVTWLRSCGHVLSSNIQDSRLWIRRRGILVDGNDYHQNEMVQSLASLKFYRKPVQLAYEGTNELAYEGTNEFLGFCVNANTKEVRYKMHPERWRYRNMTSAESLRLRLSGYFSRKHLIQKYTFPEAITKQQLRHLWQLATVQRHGLPVCEPTRQQKQPACRVYVLRLFRFGHLSFSGFLFPFFSVGMFFGWSCLFSFAFSLSILRFPYTCQQTF